MASGRGVQRQRDGTSGCEAKNDAMSARTLFSAVLNEFQAPTTYGVKEAKEAPG